MEPPQLPPATPHKLGLPDINWRRATLLVTLLGLIWPTIQVISWFHTGPRLKASATFQPYDFPKSLEKIIEQQRLALTKLDVETPPFDTIQRRLATTEPTQDWVQDAIERYKKDLSMLTKIPTGYTEMYGDVSHGRSLFTVVITNTGNAEAKRLYLNTPWTSGFFEIEGPADAFSEGQIASGAISLGDCAPGQTTTLRVWLSVNSFDPEYENIHLSHNGGNETLTVSVTKRSEQDD